MFESILIPVSLAEDSVGAMDVAAGLAERYSSAVTLLHVIETLENVPFDELQDFYSKLQSRAEAGISRLEHSLSERNIITSRAIVYGKRVEQIVQYAKKTQIDLIVLNSHPIDPTRPQGWTSISHFVAILSPCPVLLIK